MKVKNLGEALSLKKILEDTPDDERKVNEILFVAERNPTEAREMLDALMESNRRYKKPKNNIYKRVQDEMIKNISKIADTNPTRARQMLEQILAKKGKKHKV